MINKKLIKNIFRTKNNVLTCKYQDNNKKPTQSSNNKARMKM